ncbi:MAG: hypothetical protein GPOALKHO_000670 [Sodalis sp.]|nr:MAG: hypothetical protein GPOALKHO_000670 [Sodalis sp.]
MCVKMSLIPPAGYGLDVGLHLFVDNCLKELDLELNL